MKKLNCLILLLLPLIVSAQVNVDSLLNVLETNKLNSTEQLTIYIQLCTYYNNYDNAKLLFYAKKGIAIAEKEKDKSYASKFNMIFGQSYAFKEQFDSAMIYYNKSVAFAEEANNKDLQGGAYSMIGSMHVQQLQYDIALNYFYKALPCLEFTNRMKYGQALGEIGQLYKAKNDLNKALEYLEKAVIIAEEVDYPNSKIRAYYDLGSFYRMKNEMDKALEYTLKSLVISIENRNKQYEIVNAILASSIYTRLNNNDKALEYAMQAVKSSEEYGEKRLIIGAMDALSRIYFNQKKFKDCEILARKAWEMDTLNYGPSGLNLVERLLFTNIHLGNPDVAIYFFDKIDRMLEQRYDERSQLNINELEVKYETEKKEIMITTLKAKQKVYFLTGAVIGTLLLLTLVFLFFRYRLNVQKRKLIEQQHEIAEQKIIQLEQEKKLIATQAVLDGETAERSRLARDLHDGLGGMLSVVKLNLKDMKHFAIMDGADVEHFEKALDMLDQSISELRRVAHHIMPESLMRYGLKASLEDFVNAIPNAHFQYFGKELRLDSSLEILIYRCAYELINNVVKYAQATTINVQIIMDSGIVSLTVQDDGIGFDPQTVSSGMGLENIRTRLALYNGQMTIQTAPNEGTEVCIEIMIND